MRCEDARERLQEYLDGQLPPAETQTVEAHLAACAACREDLALLRQVDAALATLPVLEEPAAFTAQVMARVRATRVKALRRSLTRAGPVLSEAEGPRGSGQVSPELLPVFRLRWEDTVVSFAFACAVMSVLFAFSLLRPEDVSKARAFLQRAWWTWLPELDRLWHTLQMEPAYTVWILSSLCVAAAAAASAIVLVRQWTQRPVSVSRWG